jgi:hypothetical protein
MELDRASVRTAAAEEFSTEYVAVQITQALESSRSIGRLNEGMSRKVQETG